MNHRLNRIDSETGKSKWMSVDYYYSAQSCLTKFLVLALKNKAKAYVKVFCFCPVLLDFFNYSKSILPTIVVKENFERFFLFLHFLFENLHLCSPSCTQDVN